jgi:hypothetical protein
MNGLECLGHIGGVLPRSFPAVERAILVPYAAVGNSTPLLDRLAKPFGYVGYIDRFGKKFFATSVEAYQDAARKSELLDNETPYLPYRYVWSLGKFDGKGRDAIKVSLNGSLSELPRYRMHEFDFYPTTTVYWMRETSTGVYFAFEPTV